MISISRHSHDLLLCSSACLLQTPTGRRLERTRVTNNEAIIRNACRDDSESVFRGLPEITYVVCCCIAVRSFASFYNSIQIEMSSHPIFLFSFLLTFMVMAIPTRLVHIFQFARPEGFVADKISDKDKDAAGKPRKYDNRQNSYWYRQKKEREEAEKKLRLEKEIETADLDEMAAAAGSAVGLPVSGGTTASSGGTAGAKPSGVAADASALETSNKPKGSRTSGRKRSGDQISYNENAGDKEFEKQLRAFEKQRPAPVLKGFASVEGIAAGKKTVAEYDSDYESDDEEEKELRPIDEIIDALYEPGHKLTFSFLAPDTHLTGPCYRDFNRYVKTFPGWTGDTYIFLFNFPSCIMCVYMYCALLPFPFSILFHSQAYQGHRRGEEEVQVQEEGLRVFSQTDFHHPRQGRRQEEDRYRYRCFQDQVTRQEEAGCGGEESHPCRGCCSCCQSAGGSQGSRGPGISQEEGQAGLGEFSGQVLAGSLDVAQNRSSRRMWSMDAG